MDVRAVGPEDLDLVCRHRERMFREAGRGEDVLLTMAAPFRQWLAPRLGDGRYSGFLLLDDMRPVAGVGLMTLEWAPHPMHPGQTLRGYVLNVYVEPTHRKRGLGRKLIELAETEFARRGVQFAVLHATEMGAPLYADMGWSATTEMAKAMMAGPADTGPGL